MDPERRKELEDRRAAAKSTPVRKAEGRIVAGLMDRGVPHEPCFDGIWTPAYIRVAGNGLWWPDSPEPIATEWCGTTEAEDKDGSKRRVLRQRVIARLLNQATSPDTQVRFNYDSGFETHVALRQRDAIANLDLLLDFSWTIWITSKAENWLIELTRDDIARLAMPPPLSQAEVARRAAMARLYTWPLTERLDELGVAYDLVADDDPHKPLRPRHVFNDTSKHEKQTLRRGIEAGDMEFLKSETAAFVAARSARDAILVASLGVNAYPNNALGSPCVLIPASALLPAFDALVAMGCRDIDEEPLAGTSLRRFELWDAAGDWLVTVTFEQRYWRINGWG